MTGQHRRRSIPLLLPVSLVSAGTIVSALIWNWTEAYTPTRHWSNHPTVFLACMVGIPASIIGGFLTRHTKEPEPGVGWVQGPPMWQQVAIEALMAACLLQVPLSIYVGLSTPTATSAHCEAHVGSGPNRRCVTAADKVRYEAGFARTIGGILAFFALTELRYAVILVYRDPD